MVKPRNATMFAVMAFVVLTAAILLYGRHENSLPPPGAPPAAAQPSSVSQAPAPSTPPAALVRNVAPVAANRSGDAEMAVVVGNIGEKFHADTKGRLVQNEKTRLHLEALIALTDPGKLYDAVEDEVRDLPPAAAARARELVQRYQNYIDDQKKLIPPGVAPVDEDEALAQIEALHTLRAAHFGSQTADAFYGDEEKINRELVELMRIEKDPTLTMEQKAERAQVRYDQIHRITESGGGRGKAAPMR